MTPVAEGKTFQTTEYTCYLRGIVLRYKEVIFDKKCPKRIGLLFEIKGEKGTRDEG